MPEPSEKCARCTRGPREAAPWVIAWVLLSALGTALHWGTWIATAENPPVATFLGAGVFKQLAGVMTIPATPGWILVVRIGSALFGFNMWVTGHSIWATGAANTIGWAFTLMVFWLAWRISRRIAGARQSVRSESGGQSEQMKDGIDLTRRRVLANTMLAGAAVGSGGIVAYGTVVEPWALRVARYRVPVRDLPAALEGVRIVQICDTHLGPRVPPAHVERAMQMALDLQPDVIALVGDYVHNGFYQIAPAVDVFARYIYSYIPVVGVLGNHDWYADGRVMSESLSRLGVRMIDNGRVYYHPTTKTLTDQPGPESLCIAGVGDLQEDVVDFARALDGVPESTPRVLLSHNPDTAEMDELTRGGPDGMPRRVDLMLCGHTHGGQVRLPIIGPPIVPSKYGSKYAHGLNQGPACRVLTSAGVGLALIPVRIGVPPEVVEIVLTRAKVSERPAAARARQERRSRIM